MHGVVSCCVHMSCFICIPYRQRLQLTVEEMLLTFVLNLVLRYSQMVGSSHWEVEDLMIRTFIQMENSRLTHLTHSSSNASQISLQMYVCVPASVILEICMHTVILLLQVIVNY